MNPSILWIEHRLQKFADKKGPLQGISSRKMYAAENLSGLCDKKFMEYEYNRYFCCYF